MSTYAWFVRGESHARLAQVSIASVRAVDRASTIVVVTDEPALDVPGAYMLRFDPGLPMMVANVEAQLNVLVGRHADTWFLDTDVLLLRAPPALETDEVCVTWRDNIGGKLRQPENDAVADIMPYNFGVIGVKPGLRTLDAWFWLRQRIRTMAPNLQDWYGNQIALAALAGPRPTEGERRDRREIPWLIEAPGPAVTVRKIPGEVWNYTPAAADEDISARGALHFKGHSRPLMRAYAERFGIRWPEGLEHAA